MSSEQDPPTPPRSSKQDKGKGKAKADPKPKFPRSFRIAKPGDSDFDIVAREMHKHLDPDLIGTETILAEELERIDLLEGEELPIPPGAEGEPDLRGRRAPLSPDPQIPPPSQPIQKIIEEGTSETPEQSPAKKAILGRLKQSPGKITSLMSTTFHSFSSSPSSKLRRPHNREPLTSGSPSSHTLTATVEQSPSSSWTGQFVRRRSVSDPQASEYLYQSRQVAFRSGILRPSIPVNIPLSPLERIEVDKERRKVELAHKALETGCNDGSSPSIEDLRRIPPWSSSTLVDPSREIQPSFLERIMSPQDPDYSTFPSPPTQAAMKRRSKHFESAPVVHRWEVIESSPGEPILKRVRNPPPPSTFPARRSSFTFDGGSPVSNLPPGAAPAIDIQTGIDHTDNPDEFRRNLSRYTGRLWEEVSLLSRPTAQEALESVQEWANHPEMSGAHHFDSQSLQEHVHLNENSLPRYRARSLSDPPGGISPFRITDTNHHNYTPSLEQDTGSSHSEDQDHHPPEYDDSEQAQRSPTIGHADEADDTSGAKPRTGQSDVMRLRGGSHHSIKREDESRVDVQEDFSSSQDIAPPVFKNYWPRLAFSYDRPTENCYDTSEAISTLDNTVLKRMEKEDNQDCYDDAPRRNCQPSASGISLNGSHQNRSHDEAWNESSCPPRDSHMFSVASASTFPIFGGPLIGPGPAQTMVPPTHFYPNDWWMSNISSCLVLEKQISYQVPLGTEIEGHRPQPHLIGSPSFAPYIQLQRIDPLEMAVMQKLALANGPTIFMGIAEVDHDKYVQTVSKLIKVLRWRRSVAHAVEVTEEEVKSTSQQPSGLTMPVPKWHHVPNHPPISKYGDRIPQEAEEYPLRLRGGKPKTRSTDIRSGVSEEEQIPELSTSPALPHLSSEDMPTTSPVVPYTGSFAPQPPHFSAFQNLPANPAGSSSSSAVNVAASAGFESGSGTVNPQMITSQVTLAPDTPYVDPLMPPLFNAAFGKGPPVPYPHHASSAFHHSVVLGVHGFLSQNPGPILPGLKQLGTDAMRALDPACDREAAARRALVLARAVSHSAPTRPPVIVDPRSTAPPRIPTDGAPPLRAPTPVAPAINRAPPSSQASAPQEETRLPFLDTAGWNEYLATMSSGLLAEAEGSSSSRDPSNPIQVPLDIYEEWPAAFAGQNIQIIPSTSTALPTSLEESLLAASTGVSPQPPVQGIAVPPAESSSLVASEYYYPSLPAAGTSSLNEPQAVESAGSQPSGLGRWAEAFTGESLIPPDMVPQSPSPDLASSSPTWRGGFLPAIPASVPSTSIGSAPSQTTTQVFNPFSTALGIFGAYNMSGNWATNPPVSINRSRSASPLSSRPTHTLPRVSKTPSPAPSPPPQPLQPLRARRLSGPSSMEHPSGDDKQSTAEEPREEVEQPDTGPKLKIKIIEPTPRGSLGSNASPIDPSAGATAPTTRLGKEAVLGAAVQHLIPERSREARNKRDTSVPPPQDPKGGRQLTVPDRRTLASSSRRRSSSDPTTAMARYEARKALVAGAYPNQPIPLDQQVYLQQLAREAQASLVQAQTEIALREYSGRQSAEAARMMQELIRGRSPSPGMRSYIDETGTEYIIRDPEYKSRSAPASSSAGQSSSTTTGTVAARSRGVGRGNAPSERRLSQEVRAALIEGSSLQSGGSQEAPTGDEEERGRIRERKGKGREISEAGQQRDPKKKR